VSKKVIVIGSGFAGLAAATTLADKGYDVTILEKNDVAGGRARKFEVDGFNFDMGPSWYWMPEVFDEYFARFGKKTSDYYELVRLDPSYQVIYPGMETMKVPAQMDDLCEMFESYEKGSAAKLKQFLSEAEYKYKVGMNEFVQKPSHSIFEFADMRYSSRCFVCRCLARFPSRYTSYSRILNSYSF